MVFGNMGKTSATGVAFSRNPATGDNKFYGEWLIDAQGEDVVAGIRTPRPIVELQRDLPEAYERLLLDAMQGDASLFARADEIELAWGLVDPILASPQQPDAPSLVSYEPGSWGPEEADELLGAGGRDWLHDCVEQH